MTGPEAKQNPNKSVFHHHCHNVTSGRNLFWAIVVNLLLTVVQLISGLVSGSLSLIADAVHNLGDAISLVIAYSANRISQWPEDHKMTYGYGRAQIVGAFINSLSLLIVAVYIIYEVLLRFLNPEPIDGWVVVLVAGIALIIDLITAKLTHHGSKDNINMRAAFIHNLTDALASVGVMISGVLVIVFDVSAFDLIASLLISAFIIYQSKGLIQNCLKHLMQAMPEDLNYQTIEKEILKFSEIKKIISLHVWSMNEKQRSAQVKILISENLSLKDFKHLSNQIQNILHSCFEIDNVTIEPEVEVQN